MNRQASDEIDRKIQAALNQFSDLKLVLVFGSVASGKVTSDSNLDIAVLAKNPLSVQQKFYSLTH
jgi:predicted nucleotidyltransferase